MGPLYCSAELRTQYGHLSSSAITPLQNTLVPPHTPLLVFTHLEPSPPRRSSSNRAHGLVCPRRSVHPHAARHAPSPYAPLPRTQPTSHLTECRQRVDLRGEQLSSRSSKPLLRVGCSHYAHHEPPTRRPDNAHTLRRAAAPCRHITPPGAHFACKRRPWRRTLACCGRLLLFAHGRASSESSARIHSRPRGLCERQRRRR
ncbi:hypothetical protein C8Q77DRAFT_466674 [Trametes polyzona]|nr:hypothetical protein C8Q77DRAFT_466674 [Trametes polyzona]